jgi:hypothetical protein
MTEPRDEQILNRAYKIWEQHGRPEAGKMSFGISPNRNCAMRISPRLFAPRITFRKLPASPNPTVEEPSPSQNVDGHGRIRLQR